jgi:hypothetical protein
LLLERSDLQAAGRIISRLQVKKCIKQTGYQRYCTAEHFSRLIAHRPFRRFRLESLGSPCSWVGGRSLELGKRTLVMGIVNVTPVHSDGGQHFTRERRSPRLDCWMKALTWLTWAENPRPGAGGKESSVTARRTSAGSAGIDCTVKADVRLSFQLIPTSEVAQAAVEAGAEIVNDVSGFQWDRDMAKTLASWAAARC